MAEYYLIYQKKVGTLYCKLLGDEKNKEQECKGM